MKKSLACSLVLFFLFLWTGVASASYTMEVIGTATYNDSDYNLIWDPDNNGNSVVWLDYTNTTTDWTAQNAWASGLNGDLTYYIDPTYTVDWGTNSWRLPTTVDGSDSGGYNITSSEMGHLYYTELGNKGYYDTNGDRQSGWGLSNTGDFDNLIASYYWSGTEYAINPDDAWVFPMYNGNQDVYNKSNNHLFGLAVRSGQVSTAPIPEPTTSLLLGIGLLGLAGITRWRKGSRC